MKIDRSLLAIVKQIISPRAKLIHGVMPSNASNGNNYIFIHTNRPPLHTPEIRKSLAQVLAISIILILQLS